MLLDNLVPVSSEAEADVDFDLTPYTVVNGTIRIPVGETVEVTEPGFLINGNEQPFTVRYRFWDTRLSSIQFRSTDTMSMSGRQDFSATIISRRDLEVLVGQQWWSLDDLLVEMFRRHFPSLSDKVNDELRALLAGYGIEPKAEQTLYIQHLGADRERYEEIAEQFRSLGATENTSSVRASQNKSRVVSSYRIPSGAAGVDVDYLEISYANRGMSNAAIPTGFIGFFEAALNQFNTVVALHKERAVLAADSSEEANLRKAEISRIFSSLVPRRPFHNWGGLSVVMDNELTGEVAYYAQQVPCGRLGIRAGERVLHWDVWSNSSTRVPTVESAEDSAPGDDAIANLINND